MRLVRITVGWLTAPRRLFAYAGCLAVAGLLWGYATVHENANRKLALRQGPPPAVAVEAYNGVASRGPAGEVVLRAVADPSRALVLTMPGTGERRLAVPLFPLSGGDGARGAILLPLGSGQSVDAGALAAKLSDGAVEVNGRVVDAGDFDLILAGALAAEGRFVGETFVAVEPYVNGREAALQPVTDAPRHWLGPIGAALLLALAATYRGVWGRAAGTFLRGRSGVAAPAAPRSRPPATAHFAPLPRQEDVGADEPGATSRAAAAAVAAFALAATALRVAARGLAAFVRFVWDSVGELRSPR